MFLELQTFDFLLNQLKMFLNLQQNNAVERVHSLDIKCCICCICWITYMYITFPFPLFYFSSLSYPFHSFFPFLSLLPLLFSHRFPSSLPLPFFITTSSLPYPFFSPFPFLLHLTLPFSPASYRLPCPSLMSYPFLFPSASFLTYSFLSTPCSLSTNPSFPFPLFGACTH